MSETKHFTVQRHNDKGPGWGALANILRDLGFGVTVNDAEKTEVVFKVSPVERQQRPKAGVLPSDHGWIDDTDKAIARAHAAGMLRQLRGNQMHPHTETLVEVLEFMFENGVV